MENTGKTSRKKSRSMIWNLFKTTCRTGQNGTSHRLLRRAAALLLLAAGFGLLSGSQAMAEGTYRRSITIAPAKLGSSCSTNVDGFPVLVSIENINNESAATNLKLDTNGGHVENSSGYDIVFTDAVGTPLNHEVEDYDPGSGTLVAWVYVPALSTSVDTVIYMVYGDSGVSAPTETPTAVWDGNYQAVWHLNQAPTNSAGEILDSTANSNHGESKHMAAGDTTPGRIGDGLDFNGIKAQLNMGSDPSLDNLQYMTFTAWIKQTGIGDNPRSIFEKRAQSGESRNLYIITANRVRYIQQTDASNVNRLSTLVVSDNVWYHVALTWDGSLNSSGINFYINGLLANFGAGNNGSGTPLDDSGGNFWIGNTKNASRTFMGVIDEVRVSDITRDACWIETEYKNQSSPHTFHAIGDEELTNGTTWEITATSGANGSIFEAGSVMVNDGGSQNFLLVADQDYEVDTLAIDGGAAQAYGSASYQFTNVTAIHSIAVTFKLAPVGPTVDVDVVPPGCSENLSVDYPSGFDPADVDLVNTELDNVTRYVKLNTGNQAIDPDNIVLPFRQQVAVTFLYENAGKTTTDFGWMLASEDRYANPAPHQIIYQNVNDNDNNGVLDVSGGSTNNRFGDRNGDQVVDVRDNREILGTFDADTELIFFLRLEGFHDKYRDNKPSVTGFPVTDYAPPNETLYHYTKTAWNQTKYTSQETTNFPEQTCDRDWGNPFVKTYYLGQTRDINPGCLQDDGWMDPTALARIDVPFGLNFAVDDTASLSIAWDVRWPAVMVGAPNNNPNAWVLGFEDMRGGSDTDHNDVVFIIERATGGTVELKPAAAIVPAQAAANITGVTLGVWDFMPDAACAGQTEITYWLSANAGTNWVEVTGWDEVTNFTLVNGQKVLGAPVANWTPGTPAYTYRTRRVDFIALGKSGKALIWRAEMRSRLAGCEPTILDMSLNVSASAPGHIARATPTILANVMFSGSMETPDTDWTSAELRGHLQSTLIYHPQYPNHKFDDPDYPADPDCQDDPGWTDCPVLWNAGAELKDPMEPSGRTIYLPDVTVQVVDSGSAEQLAVGDGVTTTFSGQLAHYPVLATTVLITDVRENFTDRHTDELRGHLGGDGWINRFTGQYRLTFFNAPSPNQPITAEYSYFIYNAGGTLRAFTKNLVSAAELGLDDSAAVPSGYTYDFDNDDAFSAADANWLINWTRGYLDGSGKQNEKEWTLGALDHSVPAVATPPASSPWYYGTAIPEDDPTSENDRQGYRAFRDAHAGRRTVVYVGARDGMLHAFDTGDFRWGDNPCTNADENRGYFKWQDPNDSSPDACKTSCSVDCQPYYGTGAELWAFIPTNLLPRLKNNHLQGDDKAFVDASPALADVYMEADDAWHTVLLAAEGNGGDTIFALDVTDPDTPTFMWEFADPDLFRSRSSPAVAQIGRIYYDGTTKWVAFFVSGKTYDDTLYPSIFVIDIADGSLVQKIDLDAVPAGAGGVLSGQPAIVDSDGNGYVDRLYIGSDKGLLYKIDIPDDPATVKYSIGHCVINTDFSDRDDNSVDADWHYQPIYGSPTVVSSNSVDLTGHMTYDIRIFFGTGDSPYYDEDINFGNTRYFFYAYRDTAAKGLCDDSQVALDWFFELPAGHRIFASAFAAAGNVYFGTSTSDTEDPCDGNGGAGFDPNAGKLYAFEMDNPTGTPLLDIEVGNMMAAPVVEDQHVYVQTVGGDVDSFGSGDYNTATRRSGIPEIKIHWWREMF